MTLHLSSVLSFGGVRMCRFKQSAPRPLDPESGGSVIRRNVGSCLPVDTASSPLHFVVKNAVAVFKI